MKPKFAEESRVRAIAINDGKILLIHRILSGREFYVLPGGHVESGEKYEQALKREFTEETNLNFSQCKLVLDCLSSSQNTRELFYLVRVIAGELAINGPEAEVDSASNSYTLEWVDLNDLSGLDLLPSYAKEWILEFGKIDRFWRQ